MTPVIELDGAGRAYGERVVLRDLSLTVEAGTTLAVLGPNGAGKTTLLRMLATLLRPHAGTVRVLGHDVPREGHAVRGRLGLLAHEPLLYRDLTARENLRYHARLHAVPEARVDAVLEAVDASGPALAAPAAGARCDVVAMEVVPDDFSLIEDRLRHFVDAGCEVILTTGGTGFTPDDVTPEATRAVIDRHAPGIAEAMRAVSLKHTPMAVLSRAVAGIREASLIVNFPGSPKAVEECFAVLEPVLSHAVATLRGDSRH